MWEPRQPKHRKGVDSYKVPSVGTVVVFKPHRSAHAGKQGVVTKVTTSRPPSVRVRLLGREKHAGATEKLVLASAVSPVRAKGKSTADMLLMDSEMSSALRGQFSDLRAEARGSALKQNPFFPPSWVTEVHEKAERMPEAFVARHELEKSLGVPHRGGHGADADLTTDEFTAACKSLNPTYTPEQLRAFAQVEPAREVEQETRRSVSAKSHTGDDESEDEAGEHELQLSSSEHISWQLERRLRSGQKHDDEELSRALKQAESILSGQRNGEDDLTEKGIKPLVLMSESRYAVIQRDAAVALYSLSINENNKPKFLKSKALTALVRLAESDDTDIRLNVAGACYRLSMCDEIKRSFVQEGILDGLIKFLNSPPTHVGQEIQRYAMHALKELVENKENRKNVLDEADILPPVFDVLVHPDSRVRRLAAWTLETLAAEDTNKIRMLKSGALNRILAVCRLKNVEMRRAAASCMAQLTNFSDIIADPELKVSVPKEPAVQSLTDAKTIKSLLEMVEPDSSWDADPAIVVHVCDTVQNIVQVMGKSSSTRFVHFDALPIMLQQAGKLNAVENATADTVGALCALVDTLAILYKSASGQKLRESVEHIGTVLSMCKSTKSRIRRGGARMLERISTLEESKVAMAQDPTTVPLLLSLFKFDYNTQITAARTIAELAEAPRNRPMLVAMKCVPTIIEFLPQGDEEMQFELARALADLAMAVDNRLPIVSCPGAIAELTAIMTDESGQSGPVQPEIFRCVANLVAPAGSVVTIEASTVESNVVGEFEEVAEWRRSTEGIAWRNNYNTTELDRIHMKVGNSGIIGALTAQPHGRQEAVRRLAEESIRNLLRLSPREFDFAEMRGKILSDGYLRARTACGGTKRLEAAGWIVADDPIAGEGVTPEDVTAEVEVKEGPGSVRFTVEIANSDSEDHSDEDSQTVDNEIRAGRTKSYSQGEYGRLLEEQAKRLAAAREVQLNSSPMATPRSPGTQAQLNSDGMSNETAIDRFFRLLDEQKLRFMDLFQLIGAFLCPYIRPRFVRTTCDLLTERGIYGADVDRSGTVDAEELATAFARHKLPINSEEVQAILQELDTDGNGDIDQQEFLDQMRVAQNRRRVLAKDAKTRIKPMPPIQRRPTTMETIKSRRIRAKERMQELEHERDTAREKEHQRQAAMLREAARAKVAQEAARMKKAAAAVKVKEQELHRVRMTGLFSSYGSRLASTVLPPISHKTRRAGGTPRGTARALNLAAPMTA